MFCNRRIVQLKLQLCFSKMLCMNLLLLLVSDARDSFLVIVIGISNFNLATIRLQNFLILLEFALPWFKLAAS